MAGTSRWQRNEHSESETASQSDDDGARRTGGGVRRRGARGPLRQPCPRLLRSSRGAAGPASGAHGVFTGDAFRGALFENVRTRCGNPDPSHLQTPDKPLRGRGRKEDALGRRAARGDRDAGVQGGAGTASIEGPDSGAGPRLRGSRGAGPPLRGCACKPADAKRRRPALLESRGGSAVHERSARGFSTRL